MNPPSGLVLQVRSDAMLHQRFPQRKRFTAFFAGFLHVSPLKSVEIAVFGRKSETDEENEVRETARVYRNELCKTAKNAGAKRVRKSPALKESNRCRKTQPRRS
jgi:hypothetical protein